jgi:hypothetical protein
MYKVCKGEVNWSSGEYLKVTQYTEHALYHVPRTLYHVLVVHI